MGSALSLAECLTAMIVSLRDDHAVLTLDDWVSLGRIGGTVAKQINALEKVLAGWVGMDELSPRRLLLSPQRPHDGRRLAPPRCTYVAGTAGAKKATRDAAGQRLRIIPGGYELRAQFC